MYNTRSMSSSGISGWCDGADILEKVIRLDNSTIEKVENEGVTDYLNKT